MTPRDEPCTPTRGWTHNWEMTDVGTWRGLWCSACGWSPNTPTEGDDPRMNGYEISDGAIPALVQDWLGHELGLGVLFAPAAIHTTLCYTERYGDRRYVTFPWDQTRAPTLAEAIAIVASEQGDR